MATRRAWALNFDADTELDHGSAHTPSRAMRARFAALAERVRDLLGAGDVVIDPSTRLPEGAFVGRAFCPTPSALRALQRARAELPAAPAVEVLRRVNHRRFSADLGQTLPGARWASSWAEVREAVSDPSPTDRWLLKRPFGFSGRGRISVARGSIDEAARRWIEASIGEGEGLQVEPWVDRALDAGLHGYLSAAGAIAIGEPTVQRIDARGAWLGSARAAPGDLAPGEIEALFAEARATASALRAAGYFGPFGIDAFRWRDGGGERFNPRVEINARYSMGWAVGMGALRPDLEMTAP
jgi:hypothetical protein